MLAKRSKTPVNNPAKAGLKGVATWGSVASGGK
ncbi:hypothetical protein SAMN05444171_7878 [Bradyrhizobium lablabi]|uniref:Uncharacterized protein n=1 Tax=Bradyrhizobium lablabi TaxID=722472 RepID=A0A1H5JN46_9BRAD|nr:hypothetical protein SAMN05444171_7811 [Bradyrhizobium lablabi]SEE53058.1 hypothetical protein SAMN05444171_7878 [Bradyrhizobium lablabi]